MAESSVERNPRVYMRSSTKEGEVEITVRGKEDDNIGEVRNVAKEAFEQAVERNPDLNEEEYPRGTQ